MCLVVCDVRHGLLSHARMQAASYELKVSTCVTGEDVVAIFSGLVAGKAGLVQRLAAGLPFVKSAKPQPPVAAYFFESLTMN